MIQPDVLENPLLVLLHKCDPLFHSRTFPVAQHSNCQDSVSASDYWTYLHHKWHFAFFDV